MGCTLCVPYAKPLWFSYYGAIANAEAAAAIDSSARDLNLNAREHTCAPARSVEAEELCVPVALARDAFTVGSADGGAVRVAVRFAAECSGALTMQCGQWAERREFDAGRMREEWFALPRGGAALARFDFGAVGGVTCRMYAIDVDAAGECVHVRSDRIVRSGTVYSVAPVYADSTGGGLCIICCDAPARIVNFPCRHCCMCAECAARCAEVSARCPVCRAVVSETIELVGDAHTAPESALQSANTEDTSSVSDAATRK